MKNVKQGHTAPVVVLDAGHYGNRNQGVIKEYYESKAMWSLTNYLGAELEEYGVKVIKTRQVQALDLDLVTRGRKAQGADLFISMHSNACSTERVDRPEVIYLVDDNCGTIDEASKEIAGLLAQTVRNAMDTDEPAKIYTRTASADRDGDGKKNDDYYGVLYGAHQVGAPGIILEHSFHTNVKACRWLLDDANLRKLAQAEAATIAAWFDVKKPVSTSSPSKAPTTEKKATDPAASGPLASLAGTFTVTASALNVRNGAGTNKKVMVSIPKGTRVKCYGYYTAAGGVKWLYIQFTHQGVKYTGFASSKYLKKA